jgi:hypothetical protein
MHPIFVSCFPHRDLENRRLFRSAILLLAVFLVNVGLSVIVVFGYYYDGFRSVSGILTNVSLLASLLFSSIYFAREGIQDTLGKRSDLNFILWFRLTLNLQYHVHAIIFLRIIIVFPPEICPAIQPDDHRSSRLQRRGQGICAYQENGGAKCATCGRSGGAQHKFDHGMGRRRF